MAFFYVHYEGRVGPTAFTCKQRAAELAGLTVDALIDRVAAEYNAARPAGSAALDPLLLELRHEDGRLTSSLQGGPDAPENREDLFLVDRSVRRKPLVAAPSSSSSSSSSSRAGPPPGTAAAPDEVVKKAKTLFASKSYAQARKLCESASKQHKSSAALSLLQAEIYLATGKHDAAVDCAEVAYELFLQSRDGKAAAATKRASFTLAKAYFLSGQVNDAWQKLRELDVSASASPSRVAGSDAQNLDLDIISLQAECLFAAGRHSDAANHLNSHMGAPGAEEHLSVLLAYAGFALQYGKIPEALRALLKTVTLDQKGKKGKKMLSEILAKDQGFEELLEQLPPSERTAAAYAFLATIAKEHSAIPTCIALFTVARQHRPDSASFALNLVHAIEVQGDYDAAVACAKDFLSRNRALRAGRGGFTCGELLDALQVGQSGVPRVADEAAVGEAVLWTDDGDRGFATTHSILRSGAQQHEQTAAYRLEPSDDSEAWRGAAKESFGDDALDLLAIGFTLVKLLYLQGDLAALPALFRAIEPTRHRSSKPVHETTVRNEHAYYQCIAQVLAFRVAQSSAVYSGKPAAAAAAAAAAGAGEGYLTDPALACCKPLSHPAFAEAAKRPLYVVGDSHCLSCAWSVVTVGGQPRLVVPRLVTGVKHWHLRPESDFYPKFNFKSAVAAVPDGADVVFVLGEIDCREGILLAVERDRYASVQEGMKSTLAIFSKVLSGLVSSRKFASVAVHPVLPVLNETRPLVLAYNALYQEAVSKLAPRVAWLDFAEDLVTRDAATAAVVLRPELALDGTHISPVYCSLLQRALDEVAGGGVRK